MMAKLSTKKKTDKTMNTTFFYCLLGSCLLCSCSYINFEYISDNEKSPVPDVTKTTMILPSPHLAAISAKRFYKKYFSKKDLKSVNKFSVYQQNDSVWRVESPLCYGNMSYQYLKRVAFSDTGILLLSKINGEILYFSIYKPSEIHETKAQVVTIIK